VWFLCGFCVCVCVRACACVCVSVCVWKEGAGGLQWFQLKPPLKRHAPIQQRLIVRRAKTTLNYGQCVGLGAVVLAKLVSMCEK